MKTSLTFTFSLALVLVLGACNQSAEPAETAAQVQPASESYAVDQVIYGNPAAFLALGSEERTALIHKNIAVFHAMDDQGDGTDYASLLRSDVPLAQKDRAAAGLLATYTGPEWSGVRQMVAAPLLELHLRNGSQDLDAIERYTRALIEAENPSADILAPALAQLQDRWGAEEVRQATRAAREAASAWLGKHCLDCGNRRIVGDAPAASGDQKARAKAAAVEAAMPALEALLASR